jgi:solute carrier family 25 carnitine/acylcarnitine transporter 20/29
MSTTQEPTLGLTHSLGPQSRAGSKQALKDTFSGCIAGVVQVLVGQPFDTVKVRLQTQLRIPGQTVLYADAMDCLRKTVSQEGASALYKGTLSPLAGIGLCVSIQFGAMEAMKRLLSRYNEGNGHDSALTLTQLYIAGAVAGLANSVVSGPVEHIRTRMQVQTGQSGTAMPYSSTFDCVAKIYKTYGLWGVYKGQCVTMLREFQGFGGYFASYEALTRWRMKQKGLNRREELDVLSLMAAGAFGGYCLWIPTFPIDVIKSKLQTDALMGGRYTSMWDCVRQVYLQEGFVGFYRGFWPCMIRAAPVNAATFLTFEMTMRVLGRS